MDGSRSLRSHVQRTVVLAVPVMLARLGSFLLMVVDTAMSGHASALEKRPRESIAESRTLCLLE